MSLAPGRRGYVRVEKGKHVQHKLLICHTIRLRPTLSIFAVGTHEKGDTCPTGVSLNSPALALSLSPTAEYYRNIDSKWELL